MNCPPLVLMPRYLKVWSFGQGSYLTLFCLGKITAKISQNCVFCHGCSSRKMILKQLQLRPAPGLPCWQSSGSGPEVLGFSFLPSSSLVFTFSNFSYLFYVVCKRLNECRPGTRLVYVFFFTNED